MRSPGFELPLSSVRVPGYGLASHLHINAWKASVLTKLDDDRTK